MDRPGVPGIPVLFVSEWEKMDVWNIRWYGVFLFLVPAMPVHMRELCLQKLAME